MDLDALLDHYFGSQTPDALDAADRDAGIERLRIDLGKEVDAGRRFALWAVLHGLDAAPSPADVFEEPRERAAAEQYLRLMGRAVID